MPAFNIVYTVFSGIGIILSIVPLWWHVKSWRMHVGTCTYMIWTALGCFVHFVDSIVWNGNAINWAPVWCDINIRIQVAVAVALPACGLCIIRRIYNVTAMTTPVLERRQMITDLLIAVGIPVLQIAAEYVVSGHRFNIIEDFGCEPAIYNTPLAFVFVHSWPLIIALVSACYGALTIRASLKRRREIRNIITTHSGLTFSSYWRLIALSSLDFCFTIPLATWVIVGNAVSSDVHPWISWADTHWGYSRVFQFPRISVEQDRADVYGLETTRWGPVLCAFVFFGFFGFSEEAKENYRLLALTLAKTFGFTKFTRKGATPTNFSIHFAPRVADTQQTKSANYSVSFPDRRSTLTENNEFDLEHKIQPYSSAEQSTLSRLSSSPVYGIPRVPEPVFDPTSVRKTSTPVAVERV